MYTHRCVLHIASPEEALSASWLQTYVSTINTRIQNQGTYEQLTLRHVFKLQHSKLALRHREHIQVHEHIVYKMAPVSVYKQAPIKSYMGCADITFFTVFLSKTDSPLLQLIRGFPKSRFSSSLYFNIC